MKKNPNILEKFSLEDIILATRAMATYPCGKSPIRLVAPEHRTREVITLRLYYAIQVWCYVAKKSMDSTQRMCYYWWLHPQDNETSFRELKYSKFYRDITIKELNATFWKMLEDTANSGIIKVCEGEYRQSRFEPDWCENYIDKTVVANVDHPSSFDTRNYSFDKTLVSYTWEDIKDFFQEFTLEQIILTMPKCLHKHNKLDDLLLQACSSWDEELIEYALKKGANVNCLNKNGESPLQNVVEYYKDHGCMADWDYDKREQIATINAQRCMELVTLLLSKGADINLFGLDGNTPLMCSCYQGRSDVTKFLLENGANPNVRQYVDEAEITYNYENIRSWPIWSIYDTLEDYTEEELEQCRLMREYGGRMYFYDYSPWEDADSCRVGKNVIEISASQKDNFLFRDTSFPGGVGDTRSIVVENADGSFTTYDLSEISNDLELFRQSLQTASNQKGLANNWESITSDAIRIGREVLRLTNNTIALYFDGKRIQ